MHPKLSRVIFQRSPGYVHWRLRYGTFVSLEHSTMYMETPKNACSTTKMLFWKLLGLPEDDLTPARVHVRELSDGRPSVMDLEPRLAERIITGDEFFRFCFLRDPVSRLKSAFKNKLLDASQDAYHHVSKAIRLENGLDDEDAITFDMFALYAARQNNFDRDPHWQTQVDLNLMTMIDYHFVGLVERYRDDMTSVLERIGAPESLFSFAGKVHNRSLEMELDLAPSVRREVEQGYAADYEAIAGL